MKRNSANAIVLLTERKALWYLMSVLWELGYALSVTYWDQILFIDDSVS
jgi:hypothetical protein